MFASCLLYFKKSPWYPRGLCLSHLGQTTHAQISSVLQVSLLIEQRKGVVFNANIRWRGGGSHYLVPRTATFPAHMHVHTHKQQQLLGAFVILAQEHGKEKQERREVGKKEDEG